MHLGSNAKHYYNCIFKILKLRKSLWIMGQKLMVSSLHHDLSKHKNSTFTSGSIRKFMVSLVGMKLFWNHKWLQTWLAVEIDPVSHFIAIRVLITKKLMLWKNITLDNLFKYSNILAKHALILDDWMSSWTTNLEPLPPNQLPQDMNRRR